MHIMEVPPPPPRAYKSREQGLKLVMQLIVQRWRYLRSLNGAIEHELESVCRHQLPRHLVLVGRRRAVIQDEVVQAVESTGPDDMDDWGRYTAFLAIRVVGEGMLT